MNEDSLPLILAFWLGILTAICPCPMATNIAAISFVGRTIKAPLAVLLNGLFYTLGRVVAYTLLGMLIIQGLFFSPELSHLLQKYMNLLMGPLLLLIAMVLLKLITVPGFGLTLNTLQKRFENRGAIGAFALGILLALTFCPSSAALYFGSLIPLAIQHHSEVLFPAVYGIATGLPVMAIAFVIAFSAQRISRFYAALAHLELWAQRVTGILFLLLGLYLTLTLTAGLKL